MSKKHLIFIVVLILLAILSVWTVQLLDNNTNRILYYRLHDSVDYSSDSLEMLACIMSTVPKDYFKKTNYNNASFILFETLNNVDNIMTTIVYPRNVRWIFGIAASDKIASKSSLAYIFRNTLPVNVVDQILPKTYIVGMKRDFELLRKEYTSDDVYILKKNIQQQKDLILTKSYELILNQSKHYVVIQKVLQDPFIVLGRKCNMRVYILIVVWPHNSIDMFYYNDGFMYYTVDDYVKGSTKPQHVITSGLAGRDMYKNRPLTHKDFISWLGKKGAVLSSNLKRLTSLFKQSFTPTILEENKSIPGIKFSIFGMDVAPDEHLDCKIMEINKGPDLTPKDSRDATLKKGMVYDALSIVGLVKPKSTNGFCKV